MATTNPIVNTLPDYVEQNRLPLLVKSVINSKSAKLFTLQTGVKGATALNIIDTDVVFGKASCGWNEQGSTSHTQRVLEPAYLEVNMGYCDKNLYGKWAQSQLSIAADPKAMPFEVEFMNSVANGIAAEIESLIYNGDGDNDGEFDGLVKILTDASAPVENIDTSATAYEAIKQVYMAMPSQVADKEDAVILVGADLFRQFIQDLVTANQYHWTPEDKYGEFLLPGTACKVIAVEGLTGVKKIIAGRLSNFFYGVDMENDSEVMDLWYSKDEREFRLAVEFIAGVQVAFPDEVVMGVIA